MPNYNGVRAYCDQRKVPRVQSLSLLVHSIYKSGKKGLFKTPGTYCEQPVLVCHAKCHTTYKNSKSALLLQGNDKSLARPTSRCILFDGENISFDASLVIYINSTNIPPIIIINRICENSKSSVAVACFLPGRAKDLSALLYLHRPSLQPIAQHTDP
jgi:hypothetical protein